jgi:hypothetical protein
MFVFDRSAVAVLLPLALLAAVVLWSNHSGAAAPVPADSARIERPVPDKVARLEQPRDKDG